MTPTRLWPYKKYIAPTRKGPTRLGYTGKEKGDDFRSSPFALLVVSWAEVSRRVYLSRLLPTVSLGPMT